MSKTSTSSSARCAAFGVNESVVLPYRLTTGRPVTGSRASDRDHVLRLAAQTVLGTEEQAEIYVRMSVHQIDAVGEAAINRGGIGDEPDASPAQPALWLIEEPFQSGAHGVILHLRQNRGETAHLAGEAAPA